MTNDTIYVAAEPHEVIMYRDQDGEIHPTREDAIEANFELDLQDATDDVDKRVGCYGIARVIRQFVADYPDHTRVLLGQRDAT